MLVPRTMLAILLTGAMLAALPFAVPAHAQEGPDHSNPAWTHPTTEWGAPDISGIWPIDHLNGTPLERPEEFGERRYLTNAEYAKRVERMAALNARYDDEIENDKMGIGHWAEMGEAQRVTSLIVEPADGHLPPLTERGEARSAAMVSSWSDIVFDGLEDFNVLDRCITRGLPASMFPFMYNSGIQILQAPGYVIIRLEIVHETRIIPTDGRPHLSPKIRQWMGDSRGQWEGDTLVVETTNFTGKTPMTIVGPRNKPIPTSPSLRIVERFTRTGPDSLDYAVTVADPEVLTRPWKAVLPWRRDPVYQFFEYACHEGNRTIRDYITAFRGATGKEDGKQDKE